MRWRGLIAIAAWASVLGSLAALPPASATPQPEPRIVGDSVSIDSPGVRIR